MHAFGSASCLEIRDLNVRTIIVLIMSSHAAKLRQCKYLVRNVYAAEMAVTKVTSVIPLGTRLEQHGRQKK